MNKKGFTLVELLSVIVLLGLIMGIASYGVMRAGKKAKERTLLTKIKNIEKAAVLYGQDHKENFKVVDEDEATLESNPLCFDEAKLFISDCRYYKESITVSTLLGTDANGNGPYINADDESNKILNPTDDKKNMNNCKIQIYEKYGKIYAVYESKNKDLDDEITKCWK